MPKLRYYARIHGLAFEFNFLNYRGTIMENEIEALTEIKRLQTKIQTSIGVTMGLILILIFFSFATLLDKMPSLFKYEAILTVLIIIAFIFLKKISFALVRFRLSGKTELKTLLTQLKAQDLDKSPEEISNILNTRRNA